MPRKTVIERARRDKREGKSASTQAGQFVREEIEHVREGKHGARSTQQAIAIGLSEARRAGVDLPPPRRGRAAPETVKRAEHDVVVGKQGELATGKHRRTSPKRSRATTRALKREGHSAASKQALSQHARNAAHQRSASDRSAAAKKAAQAKGARKRSAASKKAVRARKGKRAG
ncbi:MAG TPA: DUF6496 domain-containing protein [Rhodanobacteraceae bacterium]|nr:DUF6496 domain-containing protein [Rhodanobacteraceae bacterium]